jgi:hypothetical protein
MKRLLGLALMLLLNGSLCAASKPATPADPATVILDAFRTHQLVALSEGQHWNEQGHAFRMSLIRDPRFSRIVNDIVVESGSSRYQAVMDRFIAGKDVAYDELRHAWEDTTAPNFVFDMPIYEAFFRAVRDVNRTLPAKRRLRVLLGDPPIDWSKISKDEVLDSMYARDVFAAGLVRKEVLAKNRRALLVYADGHLLRKGEETVPEWMMVKRRPEEPLVSQLEKTHRGTIFSIGAPTDKDLAKYEPDVVNWRIPTIAILKGTTLGAAPFGPIYELTGPEFELVRLEDQFDALLYLGPPSSITLSKLDKAKCADEKYMKMRIERMGMVPWGKFEIEGLRQMCGEAAK